MPAAVMTANGIIVAQYVTSFATRDTLFLTTGACARRLLPERIHRSLPLVGAPRGPGRAGHEHKTRSSPTCSSRISPSSKILKNCAADEANRAESARVVTIWA